MAMYFKNEVQQQQQNPYILHSNLSNMILADPSNVGLLIKIQILNKPSPDLLDFRINRILVPPTIKTQNVRLTVKPSNGLS